MPTSRLNTPVRSRLDIDAALAVPPGGETPQLEHWPVGVIAWGGGLKLNHQIVCDSDRRMVVCCGHSLFLFDLDLAGIIPLIALGNRRSGALCYSLAASFALLPKRDNWLRTFPKSVCGAYILRVVPMSEWPR